MEINLMIGAKLTQLRGNMTKNAFANALKVPPMSIHQWENAKVLPRIDLVVKLLEFQPRLNLAWLFGAPDQKMLKDENFKKDADLIFE